MYFSDIASHYLLCLVRYFNKSRQSDSKYPSLLYGHITSLLLGRQASIWHEWDVAFIKITIIRTCKLGLVQKNQLQNLSDKFQENPFPTLVHSVHLWGACRVQRACAKPGCESPREGDSVPSESVQVRCQPTLWQDRQIDQWQRIELSQAPKLSPGRKFI